MCCIPTTGYTVLDAEKFFRRHGATGGLRQFMFAVQHAVKQKAEEASASSAAGDRVHGVVVIHDKLVRRDHRSAYRKHFERDTAPAVKIICVEVRLI